jgi:hypothetical protein
VALLLPPPPPPLLLLLLLLHAQECARLCAFGFADWKKFVTLNMSQARLFRAGALRCSCAPCRPCS